MTTKQAISLCLLGLGFFGMVLALLGFGTDFMGLYAGARLVGTGRMYNPQSVWQTQMDATGGYGTAILLTRFPCFPFVLWPLAQLPYMTARNLWMVIQVLSSIAAVYLWPGSRRLAAVIVCWFMPLMMCVIDGIDTGLLLLWLVLWQRWEEKKPLFAGLALAMCIAKFHLFLLFPLLLFRYRRWKVIQGALIGFCGLMLLSFIAGGWNWPLQYLKVIAMPEVSPGRNLMLNIHGLLPPSFELPAVIVVVLLTTFVVWKLDYTAGVAGVLLGSLLCSYHAYIMDGVVLLPALFLIIERNRPHWLSHVAAILITPLPWIVMLLRAQ